MRNRKYRDGDLNQVSNRDPRQRVFFGIIVAIIGVGLLLKTLGIFPFYFHMSWPVILVIIGIFLGLKSGFRNNAWWILILIGVAHLIPQFEINGRSSRQLMWPVALIVGGLVIAFRPRQPKCRPKRGFMANINAENELSVDVTFGGRKEIITSKDFKGGNISVSFGGSEVNLAQADMTATSIVLDCRISFGGLELVVPANWEIQNEIRPTFGSVEDERMIHSGSAGESKKVLILQGTCTFGGIEIKSF